MSSQMRDSNSTHDTEFVRATDEFPAGAQCELTVDDVPDDEDEFGTTIHYDDRRENRTDPAVTDSVIETLLTESVVREAPEDEWDNRYLFQSEITAGDGRTYEWTLVVADDAPDIDEWGRHPDPEFDRWVLITIYSNFHGSIGTTNEYIARKRERDQE